MPEALSTKPQPYRHTWPNGPLPTGWAYPPKDYRKWADLVHAWVRHAVERYGASEVSTWYWEAWNEPDIFYWRGTPEEYHKLYDFTADAVKRALPAARVGGPHSTGPANPKAAEFLQNFLKHCLRGKNYATGKTGSPLDFVAFHAKGAPTYTNDHVRMGIANQLRTIDDGFRLVASFPELKNTPIVIGESDPEGCAACSVATNPENAYRNGTMYSSYTAASFARKHELAAKHGVNLEGALTWAFEFEDQPYFAGFRSLASNGIDKPVLNVFRLFARMNGQRLEVESDAAAPLELMLREGVRGKADVSALASLERNKLCVLAWHYHDDDLPGPEATVQLELSGLPPRAGQMRIQHFRIDENHSNAFALWKRMGSPQQPTAEQYAEMDEGGRLAELGPSQVVRIDNGNVLKFALPRQAVSLVEVTW